MLFELTTTRYFAYVSRLELPALHNINVVIVLYSGKCECETVRSMVQSINTKFVENIECKFEVKIPLFKTA